MYRPSACSRGSRQCGRLCATELAAAGPRAVARDDPREESVSPAHRRLSVLGPEIQRNGVRCPWSGRRAGRRTEGRAGSVSLCFRQRQSSRWLPRVPEGGGRGRARLTARGGELAGPGWLGSQDGSCGAWERSRGGAERSRTGPEPAASEFLTWAVGLGPWARPPGSPGAPGPLRGAWVEVIFPGVQRATCKSQSPTGAGFPCLWRDVQEPVTYPLLWGDVSACVPPDHRTPKNIAEH